MDDARAPSLFFEAVITPHRSLSERGLNGLLIAIALICGINAFVFVRMGAWPVGGFTGLELLLAAALFRLNARSARHSEVVLLGSAGLRIQRRDPRGRREEIVMPPAWLRVELRERAGSVPRLFLATHGRSEEIGRVLGEDAKRDLATALRDALDRWRNPRFDNPQLAG